MTGHAWWTIALATGCVSSHALPEPTPAVQPQSCGVSLNLVGSVNATPMPTATLALDANGTNICAHLDATQLQRAHFAASSDYQQGDSSGFAATLEAADGSTILEGWDVSFGTTPTTTFLNVEWAPPVGQTTDVIVWVRAPQVPASTTMQLYLFDPLE
jgi:hypothetical protein